MNVITYPPIIQPITAKIQKIFILLPMDQNGQQWAGKAIFFIIMQYEIAKICIFMQFDDKKVCNFLQYWKFFSIFAAIFK